MIGVKYGQWTIIDRLLEDERGLTLWRCKCEICGKEISSCIGDLILNPPKCGHNSGRVIPPDLVGQEFGNLTVIANPDESLYEESGTKHPDKFLYLCKCKCGNTKYMYKHALFLDVKYTKTCGECFREDLTGRKFTRLLVVSFSGRQSQGPYWNCICDCGNTYIANTNGLKTGSSKSCGCMSRENKVIDITGQRFNRLTVLEYYKDDERKSAWWTCLCDCGNIVNVKGTSLRRGSTNSCGCYQKDRTKKNLINKRFSRLLVIKEIGIRNRCVLWLCRCDCGNTVEVTSHALLSKGTKSCGCLQKERVTESNIKKNTIHGISQTAAYRELNILVKDILDARWSRKMDKYLKKFQPTCVVCGGTDRLAVDHVLPFSLGYRLQPGNAVRLCIHCNSSKNDTKPRDLPPDMRRKILTAALEFKRYWNSLD